MKSVTLYKFGPEELENRLKKSGKNLRKLAELTGFTEKFIYEITAGALFSHGAATAIASALETTVSQLLND